MSKQDLPEMFWTIAESSVDVEGIYPHHAFSLQDGKLTCVALMIDPPEVLAVIKKLITDGAEEIIYGLDRMTRPGQGTEFADVLTCGHYKDGKWRIGVINYQHEPRIVREWDWDNEFWTEAMEYELGLRTTHPLMREGKET